MSEIINSLKGEISRQVGLKDWEHKCKDHTTNALLKSWRKVPMDNVEELIWDYMKTAPFSLWKKCNSELLGVRSTIGEYTNKKGEKSQAHFTDNGNYIGSVKKLGEEPIYYEGNFQIRKDTFKVDLKNMCCAENITQLFMVKRAGLCVGCEEIAELEAQQAIYKEQYQTALAAKAALLEKLGITEDEAKLLLS